MGDLAVGALRVEAKKGNLSALDLLREIGTPLAARTLLSFLWDDDDRIAVRAAWSLGAVLQSPEVETELRSIRLTEQQRRAPYLGWIWAPFSEDAKPDLGIVAGRIAHLLALSIDDIVPASPPRVDQRIALPILAILFKNESWKTHIQLNLPDDLITSLLSSLSRIVADKWGGYYISNICKSIDSELVLDVPSARAFLLYGNELNKEGNVTRLILDAYTLAMPNCASALYKSLDYYTRYTLFVSAGDTAGCGEWQTIRDIPDFKAPKSWSFWVSAACIAYILPASLLVSKDTLATDWSSMDPLTVAYWIYWMLSVTVYLFVWAIFYNDRIWESNWLAAISVFYSPALGVGVIEYVIARLVCHRPISIASTRIELSIAMFFIVLILSSVGCVPVIYFDFIGTSNLLELLEVYDRVLAGGITVGVVALAIACSQWMLYKIVRSINFFRRFAIAREQRGPGVRLREMIRVRGAGFA